MRAKFLFLSLFLLGVGCTENPPPAAERKTYEIGLVSGKTFTVVATICADADWVSAVVCKDGSTTVFYSPRSNVAYIRKPS